MARKAAQGMEGSQLENAPRGKAALDRQDEG